MNKIFNILFLWLGITLSFAQQIPTQITPKQDITNKTLYQGALGKNDTIMAGDFPVVITRAEGIGNYSGEGYIVVPYLGYTKLKVSFNNIQINTDKKLIAGTIETIYDVNESNVIEIGLFDFLDKAISDNYKATNDAINQGFFYQNEFNEVVENQSIINNTVVEYTTNLSNLGLLESNLREKILEEQKKQDEILKNLDCPKKTNPENKKEENSTQGEENTKPKGSDDDVRVVETDCEKKLKEYQQSQKQLLALMQRAQKEAADKIIEGRAYPPKFTQVGSGTPPKQSITASKLREIQSYCENGALGYWEAKGFEKVENNGNPYYYCRSGNDIFYHYKQPADTYGYRNYWFVEGNWYMEGTTQQCGGKAFNCFLVYDATAKDYIDSKLETGKSTGEETTDFLAWLFVRDIPLAIITGGGSSSASMAVFNTVAPYVVEELNKSGNLTDNQALALSIVTVFVDRGKLNEQQSKAVEKVIEEGIESYAKKTGKSTGKIAEDIGTRIDKVSKIGNITKDGKFIDDILETDYQKYLARKLRQGKPPRERLDWKEIRDYWLHDSPMARGNVFNKKAWKDEWYRYNEITLSNGKRLDGYTPPINGQEGKIVSRKATDLDDIELSTFENYLKEIKNKYPIGAKINAPKYGNELKGKVLQGKHYLEIPESNRNFYKIQEYIDIAKDKYGIEIIFKAE